MMHFQHGEARSELIYAHPPLQVKDGRSMEFFIGMHVGAQVRIVLIERVMHNLWCERIQLHANKKNEN